MSKIKDIRAREILNSFGQPTIEVSIVSDKDQISTASVPSGASLGTHEAKELRDGDQRRYRGLGVLRAIDKIHDIIGPALKGLRLGDQQALDKRLLELDDSRDKSNLGANTLLAVSLAAARASAVSAKQELFVYLGQVFSLGTPKIPQPLFNIFNGGRHADTNLDFQEFLIIPRSGTAKEMIRMGAEIFHELGRVLREAGYDSDTGGEGGYAPDLDSSIEALEFIMAATIRAGYQPGKDINLGIDVGSSVLYDSESKKYVFPLDQAYFYSANLIGLYNEWLNKFPIIYLEDGLAEDDWGSWRELNAELGGRLMIAGDDLFVTNIDRLRRGLTEKAANAIIIKPNQVGTLTEAVACLQLAQRHNYKIIVSHRSGETNDDFIVDLAVAAGADYLKAGSLSRGERLAKYNRLMAIEDQLNFSKFNKKTKK